MLKTILTFSAAVLLLAPCTQAQGRRGGDFASARAAGHGGYDHHHGGGHYYYFGGVPYFFPFYDVGFGYPYYAYDYGYAYGAPGYYGDAPYGAPAFEGKIANGSAPGGSSLPTVVQQQLAKRGYYKGPVDGKFGPASRSALSRFQHQNGLQETGRIDEPTLMALGFSDHR